MRVAAASSLTEAFTALAAAFEGQARDDAAPVDVELTFGGSPSLVTQLRQGAPVDVLATADEESMAAAAEERLVGPPAVIARNRLALAVERGNPLHLTALADLAREDVLTVLCAPTVPCGRLAARALEAAGLEVEARSLEENVKGVLAKITLGEADAGLVYATDVRAAGGRVEEIDLPDPPTTSLVAAVARDAEEPDLAAEWLAFVGSTEGRAVLTAHGFLAP